MMPAISILRPIAAVLALGAVTAIPTQALAYQENMCQCLVTESSPCSCTKNWKMSPLATHSYHGDCDVDGDGFRDLAIDGYGITMSVNGRNKNTTCMKPTSIVHAATGDLELTVYQQCTNWSLTKKDGTSTVVTCSKD